MFRKDLEAAQARAEAAERRIAALERDRDADQDEIERLQSELEGRRKQAVAPKPLPAAPPPGTRQDWRRFQAWTALLVPLTVGSAAATAVLLRAHWDRVSWWLAPALILGAASLVAAVFAFAIGRRFLPEAPGFDTGDQFLILWLTILFPAYPFAALWFAHRLWRHGARARWVAVVLLVLAVEVVVLSAILVWGSKFLSDDVVV